MENFIVSFTTIIILFGLYKLFERLLPVENTEYKTEKSFEELRKKYLKLDIKQLAIFALMTVVFVYFLFEIFSILIDFRLSFVSDKTFIVKPYPEMIFIISLFSGILLSSLIMFLISKRLLKNDWHEYLAYTNLKYKFNYLKVSRYSVRIFALITGLLLVGFLDWYSAFGQKEIKLNGLLSIGSKTYKYSDIAKINEVERFKAPNGDIINDPHFIIEFTNGDKWNSRDNGFANYHKDWQIIEFVLTKTNIKTKYIESNN